MMDQGPLRSRAGSILESGVMDTPSPSPRETPDRQCPYCGSHSVVALGHVTAATDIRSDYRCATCAKAFVRVVEKRLTLKTEGTAAPKKPRPLLCAKCRKEIPPGEAHMRAPDLRAYHLACYDRRDSRPRHRRT